MYDDIGKNLSATSIGLAAVKYIRLPTILLNNIGSTFDPSSSLFNFKLAITSFWNTLELDKLNIF